MRNSPTPIHLRPPNQPRLDAMDAQSAAIDDDPSYSSSLWDWGDLLNFAVDDNLPLTLDSDNHQFAPPLQPEQEHAPGSGTERVRKRDPRMTCSNFMEGRIPCSCPELDEKLEEEGLPGKKRVRTAARAGSGTARCQVPGCEADISELKGYHKRHRVCLRCANAISVSLDGESKRYCQQCGKFHLLSDFDEGKRSCRRKLERHNTRRRRKPMDSRSLVDEEAQGVAQNEEVNVEGDDGKENMCISIHVADQEQPLEFEDHSISTLVPISQSINAASVITFAASRETQTDEGKDDTKAGLSPSYCDNKVAYSSACPTGRISFKLYDWNPAEFPRRLRHQIFQWLASMPVELEGYIRPGCTIFTVFIAMPDNMWGKLLVDPITYLHDFIVKPGKMLYGRGCATVYLNDMVFRIIRGENEVKKADSKLQAPRLHYVHPTYFEAGKPIQFIACGSNLLQPKFRFLVSFAGKYLACDYSVASSFGKDGKKSPCYGHQRCKIRIQHSEPNLFGPAFIEVENESGLSNFIPVLVGDEEVCCEMRSLQGKFDAMTLSGSQQIGAFDSSPSSCKDSEMRQSPFSKIMLDIAWLLKVPDFDCAQQPMISCQVQRFNRLLKFLIQSESTVILEKVLQSIEFWMGRVGLTGFSDCSCDIDVRLLKRQVELARSLHRKHHNFEDQTTDRESALSEVNCSSQSCSETTSEEETSVTGNVRTKGLPTTFITSETDPLLNKEVVMNMNLVEEWPRNTCRPTLSSTVLRSRPTIFLIATALVCFALCAVLYHPYNVTKFAVSIRSRLFDRF